MAWKFIQRDLQAGDILDPADWNENVREFVQEINGAFDRDNLPASSVSTGEEVASEVQYDLIMTLNGLEIAYAGPFTAYQRRQPIYMCGAAPVEAGSNTVECFIRLYVDRKGGATHTWASSVTDFDPRITEAAILVNRRKR